MRDSTIKSGELVMVAKVGERFRLSEKSVLVFLDDVLISNNIKIEQNTVSMLYMLPLHPGKHKLEIRAKLLNGRWLRALTWEFYVLKPTREELDADKNIYSRYEITGTVAAETRNVLLTGLGKDLRQELPYTNALYVDVVARIGHLKFPIHYKATTDQYNYPAGMLPRNTYTFGVQTRKTEVLFGDVTPRFDQLALNGTRIRGYKFQFNSKRFEFQAVHGKMQQASEGDLNYYSLTDGLPPGSLRPDSSFIIPGRFQRNITAMRFAFGNRLEGSSLGINILRSRDKVASIDYGL
ncbi:MAG: hypothetical protein M3Q97_04925, partial [Bacteroidota bacterium]|nr:hypothetical protein [Bacteroidota bacterium]